MIIYCPQTIIIPNGSKESILIKLDNYKDYQIINLILNDKLVDKNLIILNSIQRASNIIELKIFNLNPILNSDNNGGLMFNLMRGKNTIKINEGEEICELIKIN